MRIPIIAGNWKMNKTIKEAVAFIEEIKPQIEGTDVEVILCAPFILLKDMKEVSKGSNIKIGAQNMHFEESGAYTGEVSVLNLKEIGMDYVIIGHSERRQYFGETDENVNKKVKKALEYDINPIVCVGETLEERQAEKTRDKVKLQVEKAIEGLTHEQASRIVVAYEPIWAIGTGMAATSSDANEVIEYIRQTLESIYSSETAEKIRVQYGGSVKPQNVEEIMNEPDIDGALVGGASLDPQSFVKLVNF
ncbi:triosephosphate isomerase [Peptoclostridium litorale DSM 5388]|uniref:Triosephosphate isomerase n=1 Tax=Peptoclostridium litorale DSM 5388 TaxID=1121324 RepID=A0A069RE63_PEPLI|nr:triose-phosphate isomerase [Peptoclostridium litorale]KDR93894.1 triosephosphate isomerase TpiA [Peptoclostridium litorale DSM 5388]KDR95321.1 triosephosphate isomerase TpiA [Peptoclostridium litorale DSM 5388]SIN88053.1 triosephosphate isomerase [Peptoclostridium litorale DSM 5388]